MLSQALADPTLEDSPHILLLPSGCSYFSSGRHARAGVGSSCL